MGRLIAYLLKNKEWIFSGVGVVLLGWLGTFLYHALARKRSHHPAPVSFSLSVAPKLVTLPTGESIEPDGIIGIVITKNRPYNVCIVRRGRGANISQISFFYTDSRREAKSVAKQAAVAINAAFAARDGSSGERQQDVTIDDRTAD